MTSSFHIDGDELERVTAAVVREVPAHLVPGEVRRRLTLLAKQKQPSEAVLERARRIAREVAAR